MDEPFLQARFACTERLSRQSDQALREEVGFERLEARDHDVNSHVIFIATE